jgi:hypothetical protein
MEKEDLIIAILKENREDVKDLKEDISVMKIDVALNKEDLKIHMKRSDKIEELVEIKYKELEERIIKTNNKLTIGYLLKLIVTVAGGISVISGAIYGISRLF